MKQKNNKWTRWIEVGSYGELSNDFFNELNKSVRDNILKTVTERKIGGTLKKFFHEQKNKKCVDHI